jgi:hypothetical protein
MAAMKKRKTKAKGKRKTQAKRPAVRKKSAAAPKKKAAPRRPAAKRAAPKRKAAARAPRKAAQAAPVPRAPRPGEERVGVVTHYYGHLSVAAVRLEGGLRVGDTIRVLGHTSDFVQRVESIQIAHQSVSEAGAGEEIGLKVTEHAREHDVVYKTPAA